MHCCPIPPRPPLATLPSPAEMELKKRSAIDKIERDMLEKSSTTLESCAMEVCDKVLLYAHDDNEVNLGLFLRNLELMTASIPGGFDPTDGNLTYIASRIFQVIAKHKQLHPTEKATRDEKYLLMEQIFTTVRIDYCRWQDEVKRVLGDAVQKCGDGAYIHFIDAVVPTALSKSRVPREYWKNY